MLNRICMAAAALLLAVAGWSQATVEGRITNETGEPLPGANVYLTSIRRGAVADADGRYRLEAVPAGDYTLRISYVGYQTREQALPVPAGRSVIRLDLELAEEIVRVRELVVTATRAGRRTPMTYVDLGEEDLRKNNLGVDAPYLLHWTPSAVSTSDAGAGIGYTGIRIRGSDPTRINVTLNGIPLNDAESQGVFWVNLPDIASSAGSVQIQRGVGTSTNGAGAFGATLNLSTVAAETQPFAEVNATAGSFNTLKGNVRFGSGLLHDKFILEGRLSRITSDGYIDRARADLRSYFLAGTYRGRNSSLTLNVFSGHEETYQAWYGVPAALVDDRATRTFNPAGMEQPGEPYDDEVDNYGQTHLQLLYNNQLSAHWLASLNLHYTKGGGYYEQYKADEPLADYGLLPVEGGDGPVTSTDLIRRLWLDNDFYGTTYSLAYDGGRLQATLGGAFNIYEGAHFGEVIWARFFSNGVKDMRYYENDARKSDFNVFGKFTYELLPRLSGYLDLQYRRVGYDFLGFNRAGDNVDQAAQFDFFNPKGGLFYAFSDQAELYASLAVANREPNRDDFVDTSPDSRPRPERLYNTELGYRRRWQEAAFAVNLYHMFYRDQLVLTGAINDVGAYTRTNTDRSYRLGLEVSGGGRLAPGLTFDGNATISRNRVAAFTEFVDTYDADFNWTGQEALGRENTPLSFSPAFIAAGELRYEVLRRQEHHDVDAALMTKYVGRQYIDNSGDAANVIDPYTFTDLRLRYRWRPGFAREIELTLLVQNLFDAMYESNAWSYRFRFAGETIVDQGFYPQAGRNVLLGARVRF